MFTAAAALNINYTSKTGTIVDNTDYSVLDFNVVTVLGTGTITGPDGSIVATGVTVNISGGATTSSPFNLPTDVNGNVLSGNYTLVYVPTFSVTAFAVDSFTTAPDTIVIANVDWVDIFDEPGATNSVTVASATTPGNDGAAPITGASLSAPDTVLATSKTLTAEAGGSATITFSVTYNDFVDDTYVFASVDIETPTASVTYDCDSTQFGQIIFNDTTVLPSGQTLVSRAWSVAYPTNLTNPATPANVTSALPSIVINQLATGQWTYRLTYTVQAVQADGLIYTYTSTTGSIPVNVTCAGTFCQLICGMKTLYGKIANSFSCGTPNAQYVQAATLIPGYYIIAVQAKSCGDTATYNEYYELASALLGDCNCACDDCTEQDEDTNHWIDNSAFSDQSTLNDLLLQVEGFAEIIAGNTGAEAAYNDLVTQMNNILAQTIIFTSNVGAIEAQINALNPDDPGFDGQVNVLEALLTTLITNFGTVQTNISDLVTDIIAFQTDYSQFASYWDNIIIQYNLVNAAVNLVENDADSLLTLLGTLTPINYSALIAGIQSDISDIAGEIADINSDQVAIANQIQGLLNSLILVWNQVNQNTLAIANIPAQQDELFVAQAIVGSTTGTYPAAVNIPPQFFNGSNGVNGYVKIRVDGEGTAVPYQLDIVNLSTSQTLFSYTFAADTWFSLDVILQYRSATTDFIIAGVAQTGDNTAVYPTPNGYMEAVQSASIPTTNVLPGAVNRIGIQFNSLTVTVSRQEIHGIKMF